MSHHSCNEVPRQRVACVGSEEEGEGGVEVAGWAAAGRGSANTRVFGGTQEETQQPQRSQVMRGFVCVSIYTAGGAAQGSGTPAR